MTNQEPEQASVESEDGAAGSGADGRRMPHQARRISANSGYNVQDKIGNAACERFHEHTDIRQNEHVEEEVDDSEMQEHGREQAPPLAAERVWSIIGAP